jgi:hypothetical protein
MDSQVKFSHLQKRNVQPAEDPAVFDEAYVRVYFGIFDIEAGFRKLTWGKADGFGPLDVINPLDTSELFMAET